MDKEILLQNYRARQFKEKISKTFKKRPLSFKLNSGLFYAKKLIKKQCNYITIKSLKIHIIYNVALK